MVEWTLDEASAKQVVELMQLAADPIGAPERELTDLLVKFKR